MKVLHKKNFVLAPLLIIYVLISTFFSENTFQGDEGRYIRFAENLLNGYYAIPGLRPGFLWNGPGYPIIISPFIYFKAPLIIIKLLNSVFLFIGVIFLYRSFRFRLDNKKSLILTYFAGLTHPYFLRAITLVLTESISFFLISISLYYFLKFYTQNRGKYLVIFTISSGLLILTKVFFSYVFLALGFISGLIWIFYKQKNKIIPFLKLSFFPFIVCLPYLFYTYSLTGKLFYWSDAGGSSLYSMSTPYENEYGDWFPPDNRAFQDVKSKYVKNNINSVKENHFRFLKSLDSLNGIEKDKKLKEKAISNIVNNKIKYLKNIIYNFSRMAFRYPFTRFESLPLLIIISVFHFSILFLPLMVSIKKIIAKKDRAYLIILTFFTIYLLGTLLLSSTTRFIFPIYPILIFIISFLFTHEKNTVNNNTSL